MKKVFFLLAVLAIVVPVICGAWELDLQPKYNIYSNDDLETGIGATMQLKTDLLPIYLAIAFEDTTYTKFGQEIGNMNIWSAGLGMDTKLNEFTVLSLELGYAYPDIGEDGECRPEALSHWIKTIPVHHPDYLNIEHDMDGNIYGKIGLKIEQSLTNHIGMHIKGDYTYRKFHETLTGISVDNFTIIPRDMDASIFGIGLGLTIKF
jgi:hypothetical protein